MIKFVPELVNAFESVYYRKDELSNSSAAGIMFYLKHLQLADLTCKFRWISKKVFPSQQITSIS